MKGLLFCVLAIVLFQLLESTSAVPPTTVTPVVKSHESKDTKVSHKESHKESHRESHRESKESHKGSRKESKERKKSSGKCHKKGPDYDQMRLTLVWPGSLCSFGTKCEKSAKLPYSQWGIENAHLQNSKKSTMQINCCTKDSKEEKVEFDAKKLKPIEKELEQHWPYFFGKVEEFWSRQYHKYGGCTSYANPSLAGELGYFKTILALYKTLKVADWKLDAYYGIKKPFQLGKFEDEVKKLTGVIPHATVNLLEDTKTSKWTFPTLAKGERPKAKYMVSMLEICVDPKTMKPIDCAPHKSKITTEQVVLPLVGEAHREKA